MIYLLIGYMWLFIHRPFEVWPILADIRLERVYMILAIIYWALCARKHWIPNPLLWALFAFLGGAVFCWMLGPWSRTLYAQTEIENLLKQYVFYVMLVTSIDTEEDLKKLCFALVAIMGLYMAHSFREFRNGRHVFRMGIIRMVGVDSSMNDPNSFGASIVYCLPLVSVLWSCVRGRRGRALLVGYLGLSTVCIVLTGSRSSLVGLMGVVLLMLSRARHRVRLAVAAIALAPVVWVAMPLSLQNRFWTLIDPSVGPANAQSSAESRTEGFWIGVRLLQAYPVTGCGPGGWRPASGSTVESHNLYGQVIGEMGLVGIVTFGTLILLLLYNSRAIIREYKRRPEWERDFVYRLAEAMGIAIALLLFLGLASHNLFRYSWQWYGAFLIIARHCLQQRITVDAWAAPADPDDH